MAYDVLFSGLVSAIVSAIINIIIYYKNKKQSENAKKLIEIDNQLLNIYLPMERAIEDYRKTITGSSFDQHLHDPHLATLDSSLRDIKQKNTGMFDEQVMRFSKEFFSSPSEPVLLKFLAAVNYKTIELKKESKKYQ